MRQYTKPQRLAKARFWTSLKQASLVMPERLSDAEMARHAKTRALLTWLKDDEEFRSWFLEQDYDKALINSSGEVAIAALLDILEQDFDVKKGITGASKVAAAGRLLDAAGLGKPKEEKSTEESLEGLSMLELRKRLAKLVEGQLDETH